jgi:anti-sigma regulatory factor (Ser/Thr protein kinase)
VSKLNRLLDAVTDSPFATLALITVAPATFETWLVSAGHLPPLLLEPGQPPRLLEGIRGLPLGVDPDARYEAWSTTLAPGSVVILYTDGLVERRDRPLDTGLRMLEQAVRDVEGGLDELVDAILDRLIGVAPRSDDVALLAVALESAPLGTFSIRLPSNRDSLIELRDEFAAWLERSGIGEADRRDVMLATWEASANAIEHARDPSPPEIEVEATLNGDRVRVEVSDHGRWTEPRERPERGLGLHLIRALMTGLAVEQGSASTRVVMERMLSRERATEGGLHAVPDAARDRRG